MLITLIILFKSTREVETNLSVYIKIIYIALFVMCVLVYTFLKKKLNLRFKSAKLIYSYRYLYLAILVFVTRFIMAYINKDMGITNLELSFENGLGSYLVFGLSKLIGSQFYSIVIINTIISFGCVVIIKRLIFNITTSEFLSAFAAIIYIFLPQSLIATTIYVKYNFNVLVILFALLGIMKIIDEVSQHRLKSEKYILLTGIVAIFMELDLILGGSYIFWLGIVLVTLLASKNIDFTHISFGDKQKSALPVSINRVLYKIERINISKLVNVFVILFITASITYSVIYSSTSFRIDNVISINSVTQVTDNLTKVLENSRNYYMIIIFCVIILEFVGIVLKRRIDLKSMVLKGAFALTTIVTALYVDTNNASAIFDILLLLVFVINIGNIYYNREDKIKLLKEKN